MSVNTFVEETQKLLLRDIGPAVKPPEVEEKLLKNEIKLRLIKRDLIEPPEVLKFSLWLQETPTLHLLSLDPTSYFEGTQEAKDAVWYQKVAEEYDIRKTELLTVDNFSQTLCPLYLRKGLQTDWIDRKEVGSTATEWDMIESFKKHEKDQQKKTKKKAKKEDDWLERFSKAAQTCQRVLASNNFHEQQILYVAKHDICKFLGSPVDGGDSDKAQKEANLREQHALCRMHPCKGLIRDGSIWTQTKIGTTTRQSQSSFGRLDHMSRSHSYRYRLHVLWEMKSEENTEVNSMCINPRNPKLLAVGYGNRGGSGSVSCWNSKNPQWPERRVETTGAVTSVDFSRLSPRLLGCVTETGDVLLIDLIETKQSTVTVLFSLADGILIAEPLWSCKWFQQEQMGVSSEKLMTVGRTGEVRIWDPLQENHRTLAELTYHRTHHKDMYTDGSNNPPRKFPSSNFQGLHIELDPVDERAFYISTSQGSIISCKTSKVLGEPTPKPHHVGVVLGMQHSPFLPQVYLTYGSDSFINIWVHNISTPIYQLKTSNFEPIVSASWSTSHSTLLASVSESELCLWDLSRSGLVPVTVETPPPNSKFTQVLFHPSGTVLFVGTGTGTVTAFRLTDAPHPPYLPSKYLLSAFKKSALPSVYQQIETSLKMEKELGEGPS